MNDEVKNLIRIAEARRLQIVALLNENDNLHEQLAELKRLNQQIMTYFEEVVNLAEDAA
tara:strand:+ start:84 stop:260 length:177 start_codon:yes stop_codon:yes gene_type:complete